MVMNYHSLGTNTSKMPQKGFVSEIVGKWISPVAPKKRPVPPVMAKVVFPDSYERYTYRQGPLAVSVSSLLTPNSSTSVVMTSNGSSMLEGGFVTVCID
jgi:hypothetical protein